MVNQEVRSLENIDCLSTAYLIIVCITGGLPNKLTTLLCVLARRQDVLTTRFLLYLKVKISLMTFYLILPLIYELAMLNLPLNRQLFSSK